MDFLKKSAIILLTFFYSVCAVGMQVNVHYCHGNISSVSLDFSKSNCCCEQSKTPKKCCSDKEVQLKIDSKTLQTTEKKTNETKVFVAALPKTISFPLAEKQFANASSTKIHTAPRLSLSDSYLMYCVFRI
jgi:hypothetical protein